MFNGFFRLSFLRRKLLNLLLLHSSPRQVNFYLFEAERQLLCISEVVLILLPASVTAALPTNEVGNKTSDASLSLSAFINLFTASLYF